MSERSKPETSGLNRVAGVEPMHDLGRVVIADGSESDYCDPFGLPPDPELAARMRELDTEREQYLADLRLEIEQIRLDVQTEKETRLE